MIFPYLKGILGFKTVPLTWALFLLNTMMYLFTIDASVVRYAKMETLLDNSFFLETQGMAFSQFILANPKFYDAKTKELAVLGQTGKKEHLKLIGSLALKNGMFLTQAAEFKFSGDPIALAEWKKKLEELNILQRGHPSFQLGLSTDHIEWPRWISYQFVHSGAMHFIGNMIFLLLFGSILEPLLGGLGLVTVYLLSGIMAGLFFLLLEGSSMVPMIGASGSVSGMMALFGLLYWNKKVKYLFFLFIPKEDYAGFVFLPGWITVVVWVLSDLSGYTGSVENMGGVAHTAHLGGEMCGLIIGVIMASLRISSKGKTFFPSLDDIENVEPNKVIEKHS